MLLHNGELKLLPGKKGKEQMKNNSGVCGVFDGVVVASVAASSCTAHLLPVCSRGGEDKLVLGGQRMRVSGCWEEVACCSSTEPPLFKGLP